MPSLNGRRTVLEIMTLSDRYAYYRESEAMNRARGKYSDADMFQRLAEDTHAKMTVLANGLNEELTALRKASDLLALSKSEGSVNERSA